MELRLLLIILLLLPVQSVRASSLATMEALDSWLNARPNIRGAIVWRGSSYSQWDDERKISLLNMITALENQGSLDVPDPPPIISGDTAFRSTISESDAWKIYLSHVAQSLYMEASSSLSWSLSDYDLSDLEVFLDGNSYFQVIWSSGLSVSQDTAGHVTPGNPSVVYDFLDQNDLIADNRRDTIVRILEWSKENLKHFGSYPGDPDGVTREELHWQYQGYAPVSRIVAGTTRDGSNETLHWTPGCHGTVGLLRELLRVINIPVRYQLAGYHPEFRLGHAQPHFTSEGLFLGHGDDPYALRAMERYDEFHRGEPIPTNELLLDLVQLQERFGSEVAPEVKQSNISRQPMELAMMHLSARLLQKRCDDVKNDTGNGAGSVFSELSSIRTLSQLNQVDIWSQLDNKIQRLGGCKDMLDRPATSGAPKAPVVGFQ